MEQHDSVKVYSFRQFDAGTKEMHLVGYKATREAIASHFGGEVLEGTGQSISSGEIDEHGVYRRIATGWGDLA